MQWNLTSLRLNQSAKDSGHYLCARFVLCWPAFPSVPALRSPCSAAPHAALFAGFSATMARSDFPSPFIAGYGSSPSRHGPACRRSEKGSPGSRTGRLLACQVLRPRRAAAALARSRAAVSPSAFATASAPGSLSFRGSMAGLRIPLPTLRPQPYGCQRTARGRCGLLCLHRAGLSPATPCRSPGALRKILDTTNRQWNFYCYI